MDILEFKKKALEMNKFLNKSSCRRYEVFNVVTI